MRVRPKRSTPRLRHADTDPYPLRLLSIGDIGSRTRRRRLTGKRTLSMCRSSYQPLRSGSASEAILCSGVVRRGLGRRACARTHESGSSPPALGASASSASPRPLRRRPAPTSFASVGCWLLSSPVTHRAVTVRFAACETLASPRFPAPPPGGRLRLAPWPDARPCADGALRHGAATAQAVAAPPAHRCRRRRRRSALSISVSRV